VAKKLSPFKAWYKEPKNSKALNKRRRDKYKKDANYRAKQLRNTRKWRKDNPKPKSVGVVRDTLTIGELAALCGCNQKTIRNMEEWGNIPDMSDAGKHRRYTKKQSQLVRAAVTFRKTHHYREEDFETRLQVVVARVFREW